MPADATTSTNSAKGNPPEPIGWIVAILAGSGESERSRVCEVVWLDAELFGAMEPVELVGVSEESYASLGARLGQTVEPGFIGEQLVFRELDFEALRLGDKLKIGDAVVQVSSVDENSVRLLLLEEGLVEPGSPVVRG